MPPQHIGRGKPGCAAAHDHHSTGSIGSHFFPRGRLFTLSPNENPLALSFYLPHRERIQGRRARRFTSAQIEARVMPGAANAVADHEALSERAVVMAAMRVDGENLRTGPHQNDILIADVPQQGVGGELAQCDALDEIRASGRLLFSHDPSPPPSSHQRATSCEPNLYQVAMPRNS